MEDKPKTPNKWSIIHLDNAWYNHWTVNNILAKVFKSILERREETTRSKAMLTSFYSQSHKSIEIRIRMHMSTKPKTHTHTHTCTCTWQQQKATTPNTKVHHCKKGYHSSYTGLVSCFIQSLGVDAFKFDAIVLSTIWESKMCVVWNTRQWHAGDVDKARGKKDIWTHEHL